MGLTDLIACVQRELPHFLTLTVGGNQLESEILHMKIGSLYVPLDGEAPTSKINDLIDFLHNYSEFKSGDGIFPTPIAFSNRNYVKIHEDWLYEISRNIGHTPIILFISKSEWFADISGSGAFYPMKRVTASEFIDYLDRLSIEGVIDWC